MIRNGAVVNSRNATGWTPLHLAVVSAHFETCRILVRRGADVNAQDGKGNTPLHLACECNNIGMVDFLLRKGARSQVENKAFELPGDLCSRPVIREILGHTSGAGEERRRRRLSGGSDPSSASSTSDGGKAPGSGRQRDAFAKPMPLENKFLNSVKAQHAPPMNSPESFQDRMKRRTREMRLNQKVVLKKVDDAGTGLGSGAGAGRGKYNWNKKFLKRYGLGSKNLFAP